MTIGLALAGLLFVIGLVWILQLFFDDDRPNGS